VVVTDEGDRVIGARPHDGACPFRGEGICELHARLGPSVKPASCKQFPFVLIETPTHRRGVTEHRCPCRTMGARAPLTPEVLAEHLPGTPERTLTSTLGRDATTEMSIDAYEALEAPPLVALETTDPVLALGEPPLPRTAAKTLGFRYVREAGGSRFAVAIRRFGRALLEEVGLEVDGPPPELPWTPAFDRAEARSEPGDPEAMLRDWAADYLWSLEHAFLGTFEDTRVDLALRVRLARRLAAELEGEGRRPDRAMAEAIAIVELAGVEDDYREAVGGFAAEVAQAVG